MGIKSDAALEEHKRLLRNRLGLIATLVIIIISLLLMNLYQQEVLNWSKIDSNLGIFFLINLNVVLLLLAILLVLRNLIKLIYEVRAKQVGFRLKFKLTLAFILVSALPMVMFFFIANGFLQSSMDFWFQGQFNNSLRHADATIQQLINNENRRIKKTALIISRGISSKGKITPKLLQTYTRNFQLDGIALYQKNQKAKFAYFPKEQTKKVWFEVRSPLPVAAFFPEPIILQENLGLYHFQRVIFPIKKQKELAYLEILFTQSLTEFEKIKKAQQSLEDHRNLILLEDPIRTNFTTYLLLFSLLIIFSSIWFGYYLARSIVDPLEILVDGTKRISRGELDFQIDLESGDEIGMLLESFNSMTTQLQQNRKKLAQSQEELVASNRNLEERNIFVELVLQNIQSGIFFIDVSGYIKGINPHMIQLSKIKHKQIIGKHYKSILSKDELEVFEVLNEQLTTKNLTHVSTEAHVSVNKKPMHFNMQLYQLTSPTSDPIGRLLVVNDLTELDRLTRARAWREVARRIAHEIKNPLTPIQLSAQRIRRKYLKEEREEGDLLDSCTETIINEVNHLKNMVNEFSKFARLPEIKPTPGDINQIIQEVHQLFATGLPKNLTATLNLAPDLPQAQLDREQMKRVFTNLIDNAIAAMGFEMGVLTITSKFLKNLKTIAIEITDTGGGIPVEILKRIFDPYVTTKKEGTGLGLAIVQQIIEDHGGFIRMENIDDGTQKGAKCIIELPV
ncbi:MAG: ATP-binding protein [SAR324 cluster bacterium]|nr:ATP-binding protein [SAR324 cluster bacterium]